MKNNTLQIILTAVVASSLMLVAFTTIAVAVSYLAVGILVAVAAVDYRQGPKAYAAR
jgi:1,4-dihydroxy-2-naphthoate octaprenyltransferase